MKQDRQDSLLRSRVCMSFITFGSETSHPIERFFSLWKNGWSGCILSYLTGLLWGSQIHPILVFLSQGQRKASWEYCPCYLPITFSASIWQQGCLRASPHSPQPFRQNVALPGQTLGYSNILCICCTFVLFGLELGLWPQDRDKII